MRLTLPEPSNLETDGFSKSDIFGYSEFGQRLAILISSINEPLVITLDGTWGSGKSVFVKQWTGLIKKEYGGSVVYFDAFANDFHSDAFLALAAEIYSIANKTLDENNPSIKEFLDKTDKAARVIASKGIDIGLRLGTAGNVNLKDIEDVLKAFEDESEKAISKQLQKADEERESLKAFRDSLSGVSKSITEKNQDAGQSLPLIFIVDELDRCRPSFALEILEHIKHLFSVENVCFVLVTNLTQMEAIIKKTYGAETEARTYLEKFYKHKVALPESDFQDQSQRDKYLTYLWNNLQPKFERHETNIIIDEIRHLVNAHTLSLRQIEHVMGNIVLVAAFSSRLASSSLIVTISLCIMRQTHPELYVLARENKLSWEKVEEKFLEIDKNNKRIEVVNGWKYITDPDVPEELILKYSGMWINRFPNLDLPYHRLFLQRVFTNEIDSLLGN